MTLARFLTDTAEDIDLAAQTLAAGELLGLPTETVYGLAADALQASAVAQVFQRKGRPADHPLIVHVGETSQVFDFASKVPDFALALMQAFWPGPLTLILPRLPGVAEAAAGGHPTIALRCPSHPLAQKVLQKANVLGVKGVAAPSANLFGRVSPTTALHVREAFANLMVIDGGPCQVGIESAIVDASQGEPMLLRPGMLTVAALSAVAGREVRPIGKPKEASPLHAVPAAPGLLPSHYAPRARVRLMDAADIASMAPSFQGALAVWAREPLALPAHVHVKTMPSQAADCAHALFADLRLLDAQRVEEIWVQTPPDGDAWAGVHDRLQRAAA